MLEGFSDEYSKMFSHIVVMGIHLILYKSYLLQSNLLALADR